MGTSTACMFATLYYAFHECMTILPQHSSTLLYFWRFIDDVLGIFIGDTQQWQRLKSDLNDFDTLRWTASNLSTTAVILDLTVTLDPLSGTIATAMYQKPMNLFLYIPPHSAHPPGVLRSTVFGNLRRYWLQNSNPEQYKKCVR